MTPAVGGKVWVYALGSYYVAEIVRKTPTRFVVRYTSGAGTTRDKEIPQDGRNIGLAGRPAWLPYVEGEPRPGGAR